MIHRAHEQQGSSNLAAPQLVGARSGERIMGTESEYGILAPGSGLTETQLSAAVVTAMGAACQKIGSRVSAAPWDYLRERPLDDARGFSMRRAEAHHSQLTDQGLSTSAAQATSTGASDHILMNSVLGNGARFYVDHAHPEYSSPETTCSLDAVVWDQAGDRLAAQAADIASQRIGTQVILHKNNVDGKGASYGTHENYLTPRIVDFETLAAGLLPFFATRQVTCGAGRLGLGPFGERDGFQVSQRADYFEQRVGLETTIRRPLVNTRDEPHGDAQRFRRLHVIAGDANCWGVSTLVRIGSTALTLRLIEQGLAPEIELQDPVAEVVAVSHDPGLQHLLRLADGRCLTALDIQETYLEAAEEAFGADPQDPEAPALAMWRRSVDALRSDDAHARQLVEWRGKYELLQQFAVREGLDVQDSATWSSDKLKLIDLQWSDMRPGKGLAWALERTGKVEAVTDDARVASAMVHPPKNTRAWARGHAVAGFPELLTAASWDTLTFDVSGQPQTVGLPVPWAGTQEEMSHFIGAWQGKQQISEAERAAAFRLALHAAQERARATASDPHTL